MWNKRNNVRTVPQNLTVGQLREIIEGLPDEAEVLLALDERPYAECTYIITNAEATKYTMPNINMPITIGESEYYNEPEDIEIYILDLFAETVYLQ